ncbi:glycine/betaine ABC transporter permease [Tersicoccus solisilvae]|uniref:Glycine/betaine ABC transporter permease n=1 Tax=Tersicoccus solisilvae TaxID=1882339 RepID=A0ABQ1P4P7_9MICC|nr:ABC transporter permease [Tersicoccus solisilvae]GGC91096.1 glycine/betaine ABC transporter permease [Tersicoccus solisilvae]
MTTYTSDSIVGQTWEFLTDPTNWTGLTTAIPHRIVEHLGYSALTLVIAAVIAVPLGLYVGHTGRGRQVVVGVAGALRALPTLGLLILFVLLLSGDLLPPILALVILTIPPLLAGTYSGIAAVGAESKDAARAMGMTELQVLFTVEVPNALPVIIGGFRAAILQIIATVAVLAYVNLGGLGRFLIDGLAVQDYPRMLGGSVLIAVLAIVVDLILALLARVVVSPGLRATPAGRRRRSARQPATA